MKVSQCQHVTNTREKGTVDARQCNAFDEEYQMKNSKQNLFEVSCDHSQMGHLAPTLSGIKFGEKSNGKKFRVSKKIGNYM